MGHYRGKPVNFRRPTLEIYALKGVTQGNLLYVVLVDAWA